MAILLYCIPFTYSYPMEDTAHLCPAQVDGLRLTNYLNSTWIAISELGQIPFAVRASNLGFLDGDKTIVRVPGNTGDDLLTMWTSCEKIGEPYSIVSEDDLVEVTDNLPKTDLGKTVSSVLRIGKKTFSRSNFELTYLVGDFNANTQVEGYVTYNTVDEVVVPQNINKGQLKDLNSIQCVLSPNSKPELYQLFKVFQDELPRLRRKYTSTTKLINKKAEELGLVIAGKEYENTDNGTCQMVYVNISPDPVKVMATQFDRNTKTELMEVISNLNMGLSDLLDRIKSTDQQSLQLTRKNNSWLDFLRQLSTDNPDGQALVILAGGWLISIITFLIIFRGYCKGTRHLVTNLQLNQYTLAPSGRR